MKVLESFLIALGLQVDEKSFQKADAAFGGLTRSALQLGAVFASKLAIDKVVGDFKNAGTELNNFNRLTGLSTQNVQALGQALAAQGGNANDAFAAMLKIQDLMASPITGNVGWFGDVAKLGLDPSQIIGANDTAEALENIAAAFEKMTPLNQRLAGQALGLDESTVRLLMQGRAEVEKQLDARGKLGVMTQQQVEDAARLTKANSELNLVFTDMGNTIAGELAPALADMAEGFVDFYRSNKDLVDSGLEKFFGTLADNVELVSVALTLMGGASALKGLAALRALLSVGGGPGKPGGGQPGVPGGPAGKSPIVAAAVNPFTVGLLAALYSSNLNEGEDEELINRNLSKGNAVASSAVIDFFRAKGWTEEQAMGIAANLQQESGFRHDAEGDGGSAYGIAQWHKDRQNNFRKFANKSIRESTAAEQLEFINYELTEGAEKPAGDRLRMASTAYDAAATVSRYYERPADKDGEAERRGRLAETYPRSAPGAASPDVPVVDTSDPETWKRLQRELSRDEPAKPGLMDRVESWAKSQRRDAEQAAPVAAPAAADSEYQPVQREAPRDYTVNAVVQSPAQPAAPTQAVASAAPAQPQQINDNRQFHIHGADVNKVEQLWNEKIGRMTEQALDAFRSPER